MTQRLSLQVHDTELDAGENLEMSPNVQHRVTDVSQDAIERNHVAAPSSSMEENDASPFPQTNPGTGQEKGDVGEAQVDRENNSTSRTHENRVQNPTEADFDPIPFHTPTDDAPTPQGIEGRGSPRSEPTRPSLAVEPGKPDVVDGVPTPNIIIFGEAGVGKSSVINLIAGQKRAHISNDALGCTFQYQRHTVTLNGMPFAFWDTTGLDEGSEGTVPAKLAESNLKELMQGLAHSGGIHLVIYCIRGARLTKALKHNYDLFYTAVCRKKVPVALVVTGLEHQQEDMETWWDQNHATLGRFGMWFHAHACVTTLDVDDDLIQARRSDSQRRLHELVVKYSGRRPWKIETSIDSMPLALFRNILRGVPSMEKRTTRRVIIYDGTTSCRTRTHFIGDRQLEYELVYVDDPLKLSMSYKLAGVLVFYTSTQLDARISPDDVTALRIFYDVAGGKTCPVIVVLRGCTDDQVAQMYWEAVASRYSDIQAYPIVDERAKLDAMIEELCIGNVEAKTSRLHRVYEVVKQWL